MPIYLNKDFFGIYAYIICSNSVVSIVLVRLCCSSPSAMRLQPNHN